MRAETRLQERNMIAPPSGRHCGNAARPMSSSTRESAVRMRLLDEADDVVLTPYERGGEAMEAYLRWEELLDDGRSPHPLRDDAR
jgi:hypothetical protein